MLNARAYLKNIRHGNESNKLILVILDRHISDVAVIHLGQNFANKCRIPHIMIRERSSLALTGVFVVSILIGSDPLQNVPLGEDASGLAGGGDDHGA